MNSKWTPEELATLPQTDTVFDKQPIVFNQHRWVQRGYEVYDVCKPTTAACHTSAMQIPSGKTLVLNDGRYDLKDEL